MCGRAKMALQYVATNYHLFSYIIIVVSGSTLFVTEAVSLLAAGVDRHADACIWWGSGGTWGMYVA